MIDGYKIAADALVEITNQHAWLRKKYAYPIIFLYRHYIELSLKSILQDLENWNYTDQKSKKNKLHNTTHKLPELWQAVASEIIKCGGAQEDSPDVVGMAAIINQFSEIDQKSDVFRYAYGRDGKSLIDQEHQIDLYHLRIIIHRVENFFICTKSFIEEDLNTNNF